MPCPLKPLEITFKFESITVSIDTTAVLYVSLGLLAVMLVCVAISRIPMLRKSPRSLSELR